MKFNLYLYNIPISNITKATKSYEIFLQQITENK